MNEATLSQTLHDSLCGCLDVDSHSDQFELPTYWLEDDFWKVLYELECVRAHSHSWNAEDTLIGILELADAAKELLTSIKLERG